MIGSRSYYSARILIADDHDMVRQAICQFVETFQGPSGGRSQKWSERRGNGP